jgi:type II secretory pathway pseudopilin PulG
MHKKEGGFTIIEILITIGLIGIILPVVYMGINSLLIINKRSRNIMIANIAAENKVEKLRGNGYNTIPAGSVDFSSELPSELSKPSTAIMTTSSSNGKKTVVITISFKDSDRQREVKYKTIISETGVGQ